MLTPIEQKYSLLDGRWRSVYRRSGNVVVYPPGDDWMHRLDDEDCPCGPAVTLLETTCGCDHWMITHHALDGRE